MLLGRWKPFDTVELLVLVAELFGGLICILKGRADRRRVRFRRVRDQLVSLRVVF